MNQKTSKQQLEEKTKKVSRRYNRIFLLRYYLAGLFFMNLYWFLMSALSRHWGAIIPFSLLIFSGVAYKEQLKFANSNQDKFFLSKNKLYFSIQRIIMIGLFVSLFHQGIFNQLFPFFMFNAHLRLILGGVNLLGILLCVFCLRRIKNVSMNRDKYYLKYEK